MRKFSEIQNLSILSSLLANWILDEDNLELLNQAVRESIHEYQEERKRYVDPRVTAVAAPESEDISREASWVNGWISKAGELACRAYSATADATLSDSTNRLSVSSDNTFELFFNIAKQPGSWCVASDTMSKRTSVNVRIVAKVVEAFHKANAEDIFCVIQDDVDDTGLREMSFFAKGKDSLPADKELDHDDIRENPLMRSILAAVTAKEIDPFTRSGQAYAIYVGVYTVCITQKPDLLCDEEKSAVSVPAMQK